MNSGDIKKYAILKYFSIIIGVVIGIVQPKIFSVLFAKSDFAALTVLFGLAAFISFFDLGFGKPVYAELRARYVKGSDYSSLAFSCLVFFAFVAVVACAAVTFASAIYIWRGNYGFNMWFCVLFSIVLGGNLFVSCIENILNALDKQIQYAALDAARRIANLGSLFFAYYDHTLVMTLIINTFFLIVVCIAYALIVVKLSRDKKKSKKMSFNFFKSNWSGGKNYFFFTVNETLIYNGGYLIFPLALSDYAVVQYGLWMRIFLGLTLVMGVVANIFIHSMSRLYFEKKIKAARDSFLKALQLSILLSFIGCLIFALCMPYLFPLWVGIDYVFSTRLLVALFTWCIGNAVQHCSGTFLLSTGSQFLVMRNASLIILIVLVLLIVPMAFFGIELDLILMASSLVYFLGAIFYLTQALALLNKKNDIFC